MEVDAVHLFLWIKAGAESEERKRIFILQNLLLLIGTDKGIAFRGLDGAVTGNGLIILPNSVLCNNTNQKKVFLVCQFRRIMLLYVRIGSYILLLRSITT